MKLKLLRNLCFIFLTGCSVPLLLPSEKDVDLSTRQGKKTDIESLQKGYHLYVNKCGGCHYLHRPIKFSEEVWRETIPVMAKKAKITQQEQELILNYVLIIRSNAVDPNNPNTK